MAMNVWEPLAKDPDGAFALVEDLRKKLVREGRNREAKGLRSPQELLGDFDGALLRGHEGSVDGVVFTQSIREDGCGVELFALKETLQTASGFKQFVENLLSSGQGDRPVLLIWDSFNQLDFPQVTAILEQAGFHSFHRYDIVWPSGKALPSARRTIRVQGRLRNIGPEDLEELSRLEAICFADQIYSVWGAETKDPIENARRFMRCFLEGGAGQLLGRASFGLEVDGKLAGYCIATREEDYISLSDLAVLPDYRGQGLASHLLRSTLGALLTEPGPPIVANVIRENRRVSQLCNTLGFEIQSGPHTIWARTKELGILPPEPVDDTDAHPKWT
jgi:ribosomal protein S18 acetylase RimI-like enzyme